MDQQQNNNQEMADHLKRKCEAAGEFEETLATAIRNAFGSLPFYEDLEFWFRTPSGGSLTTRRKFALNWSSRDDVIQSLEEGLNDGILPPELSATDRGLVTGIWSLVDLFREEGSITKDVTREQKILEVKAQDEKTEDEKSFLPTDQLTRMLTVQLTFSQFQINLIFIINYPKP